MALKGKYKSAVKFELVPEGVHHAVCFAIYDLGTQESQFNEKIILKPQILIMWELPNENREDGSIFTISKKYTRSLHEKAQLRKDIEAWKGKKLTEDEIDNFDITEFIGMNCQLQIIHTQKGDKTYTNIASIMALPKGTPQAKPINSVIAYEIENPIPKDTPNWIKDLILKAEENKSESPETEEIF